MSTAQRFFVVGCSLSAVLLTASCSVRGDSTPPTSTPNDFFVIVTPTPGTPEQATNTPEIVSRYVVQPGDSLLEIAVQFGVTLNALQEANDIQDPDSIYAGQILVIPPPVD